MPVELRKDPRGQTFTLSSFIEVPNSVYSLKYINPRFIFDQRTISQKALSSTLHSCSRESAFSLSTIGPNRILCLSPSSCSSYQHTNPP
jgi:hypothetical protein